MPAYCSPVRAAPLPSIIRDIALEAAKAEYKHARMLGATADQATIAGCKVMLDIRKIAGDCRRVPMSVAAPDNWWLNA